MKILKKNKYYLLILCACLIIMIYSVLSDYNFFQSVWRCLTESDYIDLYNSDLFPGEVPINNMLDFVQHFFKYNHFNFDYIMIFGTNSFQVIMPFLCVITGVRYHNKFYTVDKLKMYRFKKIKYYLSSTMLKQAFLTSIFIFLSFVLYYLFCLKLANAPIMEDMRRDLFADIFGSSFYYNHLYLYYFLEGIIKFFVVPFVLTILSLCSVLFLKKRKVVFTAMPLFYYGMAICAFVIALYNDTISMYLNPTSIMASGTFIEFSTILLFIPYFIMILLSIFLVIYYVNKYEI